MTIKIILTLLTCLTVVSCENEIRDDSKPTSNNVFASLDYDKVIAYNYDGQRDIEIIDEKTGQLAGKIKKQIELDSSQVTKFTNDLCDKSTYGGDVASCFNPRLGIVYYKKTKPIAHISICLECNFLVSSIKIPNAGDGFSKKGIQRIEDFQKEIGY